MDRLFADAQRHLQPNRQFRILAMQQPSEGVLKIGLGVEDGPFRSERSQEAVDRFHLTLLWLALREALH